MVEKANTIIMGNNVKILISIGSNYEQESHVKKAKEMLLGKFPGVVFSPGLWTKPIGMESDDFLNLLAVANTQLTLGEVETILKEIENECDRKVFDKAKGIVKIDLDILMYDRLRLHEHDWQRIYIKKLLGLPLFEGILG